MIFCDFRNILRPLLPVTTVADALLHSCVNDFFRFAKIEIALYENVVVAVIIAAVSTAGNFVQRNFLNKRMTTGIKM